MSNDNGDSSGIGQTVDTDSADDETKRDPSTLRADGGETKAINVEVPDAPGVDDTDSEDAETAYVNIHMPAELYAELLQLKEDQGTTWRGLLVRARRELNGYPSGDDEKSQYELLQESRKRHGLTWKGMLLEGARQYDPNVGPPRGDSSDRG
jgi:hypothetical protein